MSLLSRRVEAEFEIGRLLDRHDIEAVRPRSNGLNPWRDADQTGIEISSRELIVA